jgi:uncharacterized protein YdaU (DUF1376 family)
MHYYRFHVGDYVTATVHLQPLEDLAYRRLLDMYYDTERPIPLDTQWVSRRLRLETQIIDSVLSEFFVRTENGWISSRCDEEIASYHRKADANRTNGKLGGRPKKTQSVTTRNPTETQNNLNQEPRTKNQEESKPLVSHDKIVFDGIRFQNVNGQIKVWAEAYPAIDIQAELNKAAAWVIANPKNVKKQWGRFLNSWLSRAQDKAPRVQAQFTTTENWI